MNAKLEDSDVVTWSMNTDGGGPICWAVVKSLRISGQHEDLIAEQRLDRCPRWPQSGRCGQAEIIRACEMEDESKL